MEVLPFGGLEEKTGASVPQDLIEQLYINYLEGIFLQICAENPEILVKDALLDKRAVYCEKDIARSGINPDRIFERAGVYNSKTLELPLKEYLRNYIKIAKMNLGENFTSPSALN